MAKMANHWGRLAISMADQLGLPDIHRVSLIATTAIQRTSKVLDDEGDYHDNSCQDNDNAAQ